MNKRSGFVAGVLIALMLAMGLTLSGCTKEEENITRVFPPKLEERIEFHQSKSPDREEKIRIVQYAPDGVTKTGMRIEYKNNNSADLVFRTKGTGIGTIESVTVSYPAKEGSTARPIARQLQLDFDGKTYLKDQVWREDGVLQYSGVRVSDTKYVTSDFREDGATVLRKQEFLKVFNTWKLDLEEQYRPDLTVETSVKRMDDGSLVTKKFTEDNKIAVRTVLNRWESDQTSDYYDSNGNVEKRINQTSYDVTVTFFKNGKTSEVHRFYAGFSSMQVTFYDDNGNQLFSQRWVAKVGGDVRTDGKVDPAKFRLSNLEYFEGTTTVKYVDFYPDGVTPQTIRTHDPKLGRYYYPATIKRFRLDGTLSEVAEHDGNGRLVKTEKHTADENIRETVAAGDQVMRPFENPPEMQKGTTPYYYPYY